ncbi:MAG: hypothetical protein GF307_01520 [candidate division Zixibacteria bacterium]|nr:hypothetical protein [candidate division Zixibacteria bacterium]
MYHNWKRLLALLLLIFAVAGNAHSANILGVRWLFQNMELLPDDFAGNSPKMTVSPYLGGYLRSGEFLYIGTAYNNIKSDFDAGGEITGRIIQPYAGIRYYIGPRNKRDVTPYIGAEFYKSFTSLKNDADSVYNSEDVQFLEKLYAPWGFAFSVGADYGAADALYFGMEAGLQWAFSKPEAQGGSIYGNLKQDRRDIRLYTLIHIDFLW